jgi:hypothetical protein
VLSASQTLVQSVRRSPVVHKHSVLPYLSPISTSSVVGSGKSLYLLSVLSNFCCGLRSSNTSAEYSSCLVFSVPPYLGCNTIQPLGILETRIAGRPQMCIRFYGVDHVSCVRMQNFAPQHGDVFYLRCILTHHPVLSWIDAHTTNSTIYGTYQEAARAMGIFSSKNKGEMASTELVELGVSPAHFCWMYCVLTAKGSPMLRMWERHQSTLGGDLRDHALRTGAVTNPVILCSQVLE